LLKVLAQARKHFPKLKLVKIGGTWNTEQIDLINQLLLQRAIDHRHGLSRSELADIYRTAPAVLIPSESEGFGLPLVEALACGAPVLCSDIPTLREVGGEAVVYETVGDIGGWTESLVRILNGNTSLPSRSARLEWASQFTWRRHAEIIADAYRGLL
jgi:glycosyltransferase involved in cell wall biosynthesis